jgi:hypothetical protein
MLFIDLSYKQLKQLCFDSSKWMMNQYVLKKLEKVFALSKRASLLQFCASVIKKIAKWKRKDARHDDIQYTDTQQSDTLYVGTQ